MAAKTDWIDYVDEVNAAALNAVGTEINGRVEQDDWKYQRLLVAGGHAKVDYGFVQSELSTGWWSEAEMRACLQGIKDIGATRVRFAAYWSFVEPTLNGGYTWTDLDAAVNLIAEYELAPLLTIVPPVPTGSPTITDFAELCGAIAARYGSNGTGKVSHFQVWNEPNNSTFAAPFTFGAAGYTALLTAAAAAIRAADPQATVVMAGLMSTVTWSNTDISPSDFITGVYSAGGGDDFDVLAFHWYTHDPGYTGWNEPAIDETFYEELVATRAVMVSNGDGDKSVWITEVGLPEPDVDADVRADWLATQVQMLNNLEWVETFYVYNFRCSGTDLGTEVNQYGICLYTDLVPRQPTYRYLASINQQVSAKHIHPASDVTDGVSGSVNGTATALTLWTGSASQYAAVNPKSSTTVYIVTA